MQLLLLLKVMFLLLLLSMTTTITLILTSASPVCTIMAMTMAVHHCSAPELSLLRLSDHKSPVAQVATKVSLTKGSKSKNEIGKYLPGSSYSEYIPTAFLSLPF